MTDQQKPDRPQTLLEAANELLGYDYLGANLRAAIAREKAQQASLQDDAGRYAYWKSKATRYESERDTCYSDYQKEAARAQQAESTAAWHKAESERLSAELAKARAELAESGTDAEIIKRTRQALGCPLNQTTWVAAAAMRERAEKAEGELAKATQARQLDRAVDVLTRIEPRDPTTGFTFATYRHLLEALRGKS